MISSTWLQLTFLSPLEAVTGYLILPTFFPSTFWLMFLDTHTTGDCNHGKTWCVRFFFPQFWFAVLHRGYYSNTRGGRTASLQMCQAAVRWQMLRCWDHGKKKKDKVRNRLMWVKKAGTVTVQRSPGWSPAEHWTVDLSLQLLDKSVICSVAESTSGEVA